MGQKRISIIGGGFTGLAAAFDLSAAGWDVTVFESEPDIGGLAGTFEISPGVRVEKFYHHWFTSDRDALGLIDELGLSHLKRHVQSNTGLYHVNSIFRLASPFDLLKFSPIPLIDRIRTGVMALRARRINDHLSLEGISAEEWLIKLGGKRAYDTIWKPLMQGKFGVEAPNVSAVWIWNKLKLRGSSRNEKGSESLVYCGGSFGTFTDALRAALEKRGVKVLTNTAVKAFDIRHGKVLGVVTSDSSYPADHILATTPLPIFLDMTPELPAEYREGARQIRFLGNSCLVLRLTRSLSSTYWLNVADPTFPFVGIIEHTNLDPKENYGGAHIVYLSKYLPTSEPLFNFSNEEMYAYCEPFIQRIFPEFNRSWVLSHHTWKARYSQPVITKHYSQLIPPFRTPIKGLWLCTMAQVYPEDRGTNYAVRYGRKVAREIISES